MKKNWVRLVFALLLTAVFLYLAFRKVDWASALRSMTRVDPAVFLIVVLLVLLAPPRHPGISVEIPPHPREAGRPILQPVRRQRRRFHGHLHLSRPDRRTRQAALCRPQGELPARIRHRDGRRRADLRHLYDVRPAGGLSAGPAPLCLDLPHPSGGFAKLTISGSSDVTLPPSSWPSAWGSTFSATKARRRGRLLLRPVPERLRRRSSNSSMNSSTD